MYGFEGIPFSNGVHTGELDEVIESCEHIILPLPVTANGVTLNADYLQRPIFLNEPFARKMLHKKVYGGVLSKLYETSTLWKQIDLYDYYAREEFIVQNTIPTAEGALEIAMREYPGTIHGSRCLVAGFGRVGKAMTKLLKGVGADVTVSARRPGDLAWISLCGCTPVKTARIFEEASYDIVFNTIPALAFNRRILSKAALGTLFIDLASAPGGIDYEAAEEFGLHTIQALGLPAKAAPKTAGEIIKQTIYNIIEE